MARVNALCALLSVAAGSIAWQRGVGDASTLAVGLLGGAANLAVAGWQWRDGRRRDVR